jgi:uncharacterized membrane protein YagU involved in acid resistance
MSAFYSLFANAEGQSQPADEDSTVKTASAISQAIFHHGLTDAQKERAGPAVHYAFGTAMGALYGVLANRRDSRRLGWGLPFGAAIWLGAHVITVPALGLSKPITRQALLPKPSNSPRISFTALWSRVSEERCENISFVSPM